MPTEQREERNKEFAAWVEHYRDQFGSDYEVLFANSVLPRVEGLTCNVVTVQYPFVDRDGKNRYCDFTIIESETVRLAIEIDGYDKRGTGSGMTHDEFLDWQRRQASLAAQGWHVLRFANRDVRDHPQRCAEHVSQLLKRLRQSEQGRVEIVTLQGNPGPVVKIVTDVPARSAVEPIAVPKQRPPRVAAAGVMSASEDRNKRKSLFVPAVLVAGALLVGVAFGMKDQGTVPSVVLARGAPLLWSMDAAPHSSGAQKAPTQAQAAPEETLPPVRAHSLPQDAASTLANTEDTATAQPAYLSYGTLDCKNPIDWSQADQYVGQVVSVAGPLHETRRRPDVSGSPMWIDMGGVFPNPKRFTVVLWGKHWHQFDLHQLDADYWFTIVNDEVELATLCIRGTVREYKGVPQIELQDKGQFIINARAANYYHLK